ncbi:RNase A-like domain-containing protein [Stappia sp.]|uniref:RNase A-like domain-containing protein n=1 Tax=Stappia sp. TaxID=1870903 RepID=UPI003C7DCADC
MCPSTGLTQARGVRQARPRSAASSPRRNRVAAALRSQSERFGGHLNASHVGKSRAYLKERSNQAVRSVRSRSFRKGVANFTRKEEKYLATQKALRSIKRQKNRRFSTFSNAESAERAISIAISNNRDKIKKFMKSESRQITITARSKTNFGTIYFRKDGKFRNSNKAQFLLRKAGSRYYIHTGHPI